MAKNYTIVDEKLLVSGFFDVVEATTEFPSQSGDGTVRTHPMMVMKRTPAATIAVWDPELDVVLMIEEYRVGAALAGLEGEAAWPLSTIAGMVDEGEDPKEAIIREAEEEAGIQLDPENVVGPISTLPSAGGLAEIIHVFVGTADLSHLPRHSFHGLADESEEIKAMVMPREEVMDYLLSGEHVVAGHCLQAMFYLERKMPDLLPRPEMSNC